MSNRDGNVEISGKIMAVIFVNDENAYTVLRLDLGGGEIATVTGTIPSAMAGETLHAKGQWKKHPSHGEQFQAEFCERSLPNTAEAIYSYLAGGAIKGVGAATASLIVTKFGSDSLDVIETEPHRLTEIKGINLAKAQKMSKDFKRQSGLRRLMEFMCRYELRPMLALRLHKNYGDDALGLIKENPYLIASPMIGGEFSEADCLALSLGIEADGPERISAAVCFELQYNLNNGHSFIPMDKLVPATAQFINVDEEQVMEALDALIDEETIVCEEILNRKACYLRELYEAERYCAEKLRLMLLCRNDTGVVIDKLIDKIETQNGISYAEKQRETIELAHRKSVLVITGGPGTGKTTTIKAILAMFDELGLETQLAAPTGRAAKRMTELTARPAATIHRLLEANFSEDGEGVIWGRDASEPLVCDALIVDECSMIDILLMRALLEALPNKCRLILVGDADQLPSVGAGNVFSDIIRSELIETVRLTEIFRQSESSAIIRNAHKIINGECPDFRANNSDFFFLRRLNEEKVRETIVELCSMRLPNKMGIPTDEIQVLSPTRKGGNGTVALNKALQAALNPPKDGKNEKIYGEIVFREGDRVMQIRNNYDIMWLSENVPEGIGVYNGDVGYILGINNIEEIMSIDFDGKVAAYSFEQLMELEHAWAVTVHKSQGSEYRAVVLAISNTAPALLTRSILYTAVTRAKNLMVAVGDDYVAAKMVENHKQSRRYSGLRLRLCSET